MSNALHSRLASLYSPRELQQLARVSDAMLTDPTVFDTHSREVRNLSPTPEQEKQDGTS